MRANGNLDSVTASQGGTSGMLEPGGYACLIHEVIDGTAEPSPYIDLVLNVLDPETKRLMYTQDLADPNEWWRHTYRYFVSEYGTGQIDWGRYKALVDAVEQTEQNKGFKYQDVDGGEQQLKGKWLGVVFRNYLYVPRSGKNKGKQREGLELSYVLSANDAIAGNFDPKHTQRRDGRPEPLKGTPYPPEPAVVPVPASVAPVTPAATPVPAPAQDAAPDVYDEDIPF